MCAVIVVTGDCREDQLPCRMQSFDSTSQRKTRLDVACFNVLRFGDELFFRYDPGQDELWASFGVVCTSGG